MKKRIALGVVAALAGGLLAAAPASAATDAWDLTVAEYVAVGGESAIQIAGAANYVTLAPNAQAAAANTNWTVGVSGAGATIGTVGLGLTKTADSLFASSVANVATAAGFGAAQHSFTVMTPQVGTVTVKVYKNVLDPATGISTTTLEETMTVKVNAAATAGVVDAAAAVSLLDAQGTTAGYVAPAADETSIASSAFSTAGGVAGITLVDVNGAALNGATVTATVAGPGLVSLNSVLANATIGTAGRAVANTASAGGVIYAALYADGTAGKSTITFTVSGKTVGTETVTYYGAAASLAATVDTAYVADGAATLAFQVVAKDANGVVVPSVPLTYTSSDATIATAAGASATQADVTAGNDTATVTAVAAKSGKVTFTIVDTATGLLSTTAAVTVSSATAAKITIAFDKASYAPGEKGTVTLTATDANGLPIADGVNAATLAAALTTSTGITATLFAGGSATFTNGKATATFYAPLITGPFSVAGTIGAGHAVAIAGTALSASAAVAPSAEATAQAAAITALQTAVASLQTTIASLVASMTVQIKVINAALAKIAKSLKVKI